MKNTLSYGLGKFVMLYALIIYSPKIRLRTQSAFTCSKLTIEKVNADWERITFHDTT